MNSYLNDRKAIDRLKREYLEHKNLVIGFDFDDTVFPYHEGIIVDDVLKLLQKCKKLGFTLCIWSTCSRPRDIFYKIAITKSLNIEPNYINESPIFNGTTKPYFSILLDDRAGLSSAYNILLTTLNELEL